MSKLTHQVYIYAIPYLWAFPPARADLRHHGDRAAPCAARRPQHRRPDDQELPVGRPDRGQLRGQGPRRTHRDPDGLRQLRRRGTRASTSCIVKDGKLASPSRNALPGITRKTVFELADAMGIEATLRDVTSHELYDADELMAVTTAGGVTPINTLDGEPIGDGTPGPMTVAIRDRFWALMDEPSPLIEAIEY